MGFNLSWIAVEQQARASLLDRLGFEEVGEGSDEHGAAYSCATLPNGWLILVATDRSFSIEEALALASLEGFALGCEMSETVMYSQVRAFQNGCSLWSVTHDPDKDPDGVAIEGEPPPHFAEIRDRLRAEQTAQEGLDVDYLFDIPPELAASVCGYRPGVGLARDWTILQKRGARTAGRAPKRPHSLSAAIRSELFPLAASLGWEPATDHPELERNPTAFEFVRARNACHPSRNFIETMFFNFQSGERTDVVVSYAVFDRGSPNRAVIIQGSISRWEVHVPFWKRVLGLQRKPPPPAPPEDPIGEAIGRGREQLLILEELLKTGAAPPGMVHMSSGLAKTTWPQVPDAG